jgi:hypothetical protein
MLAAAYRNSNARFVAMMVAVLTVGSLLAAMGDGSATCFAKFAVVVSLPFFRYQCRGYRCGCGSSCCLRSCRDGSSLAYSYSWRNFQMLVCKQMMVVWQ